MIKKINLTIFALIAILVIFYLNYRSISPWFAGRGPLNLGSIEVSYVSMSRFLGDFFPHLSYAPYWYLGFPFHLFYTPILPFIGFLLNRFVNIPFWQAYRLITGVGFVLAPVSLFLFTWELAGNLIAGVLAGLGFAFMPTLFYFILPSREVASDVITAQAYFFDPRRLVILARWGEGPHILSLFFLPLAGFFFLRAFKNRRLLYIFLSSLFIALTALTNAVGFYGLVILLFAVFASYWIKKSKSHKKTFRTTIFVGLGSYGLMAFWYNLSFIGTFFGESGGVMSTYISLFPWGWLFILFGLVILYFFFQKIVRSQALIAASIWFLAVFTIVAVYYFSASVNLSQNRLELVPQALRLMVQVDMALAVFLATIIGKILNRLQKKGLIFKIVSLSFGLVLIFGQIYYALNYLPYSQKAVSGEIDLKKTDEFRISQWLKENIDSSSGERVFVAGNYSFYLNYFANVWQSRGGLYQANTHPWSEHLYYQVVRHEDPEISLAWLKIANIKYLVVNTPQSSELYKDFHYPEKFSNLKSVYEERGDIIYGIPLVSTAPAKVVSLGKMDSLVPPKKGDDKKAILNYADWLAQSRPADFTALDNDHYQIKAQVKSGEAILIQMTYSAGFQATSSIGQVKVSQDPFGFIVLTPQKEGEQEIKLTHSGILSVKLGYVLSIITWLSFLGLGGIQLFQKKRPSS